MTTPEGAKGWDSGQARHDVPGGGNCREVAPDAHPEGVRVETRCEHHGDRGEPSNAPTAAHEHDAASLLSRLRSISRRELDDRNLSPGEALDLVELILSARACVDKMERGAITDVDDLRAAVEVVCRGA